MDINDYNVNIFLIFEELNDVDGNSPPTARKDLSKFLQIKRKPFIKCFHIVAVNPTAHVYLARDLQNTVHSGLLRPAIEPFLQAITSLGFCHLYYGALVPTHSNHFLHIRNGSAVTQLKSYSQLDFKVPMVRVNPTVVGQRWNSQYTWGVASMNMKQSDSHDLVKRPTIKTANVTDGILPQFVVLSNLLLEIDKDHKFYCGLAAGNARQIYHAECLMEEDPLIPDKTRKRNVIESVSGICNVYSKASSSDMFMDAHNAKLGADHSGSSSPQSIIQMDLKSKGNPKKSKKELTGEKRKDNGRASNCRNKKLKETPVTTQTLGTSNASMANYVVNVDLFATARRAWRERYVQDLPEINAFGDSFKKISTVWTQGVSVSDQTQLYTTTEYPPLILDEFAIPIPNQEGVAFNNQRNARYALLWWIICTVPSVLSRRRWAKELLGKHTSALLVALHSQAWCTLSQDTTGSF
jgi:hypothetical protein